jgi:catechol 2,3-dioxygenase-like lactoylglutathione lyase family enzyme
MQIHSTAIVPVLRMFDAAKARDFYLDFLGFQLDFEHRFAPDLPLYMQISLGNVRLHLSEHYGDCSPGARVLIEMTGLADYQAALLAKRHGYARPGLKREDWRATTMSINDPFFNMLVFTEHDAKA